MTATLMAVALLLGLLFAASSTVVGPASTTVTSIDPASNSGSLDSGAGDGSISGSGPPG